MFGPDGMSIGLGIFLASLYLGTIYLYVQTRDRWDWSRLIARGAFVVIGAGIGAGLIYGGMVAYQKWEARPRLLTGIGPISVGDRWSDISYRLGKFKDTPRSGASKYPGELTYSHETLPLAVNVVNGRALYVIYHCREADRNRYGSFNGIGCDDDGNAVMKAFGDKVRVLCRKQAELAHMRAYDVVEYGTRYVMISDKVSSIGVADPAELAGFSGINWDKCEPDFELRSPDEAKNADGSGTVPVKAPPAKAKTHTSGR